ncbi:unnamed protein product, partial [Porites evermanni]
DENECEAGTHSCDANAQCSNTIGSFTCACLQGYTGNGLSCSGENEKGFKNHLTTFQLQTVRCLCFYGKRQWIFTDINECTTSAHDCHAEAVCSNTDGSFTCNCNQGYTGDGEDCAGRFSIYV